MSKRIGLALLVAFLLLHHAKPKMAKHHHRMHEWHEAKRRGHLPEYV